MQQPHLDEILPPEAVARFCKKWKIAELYVFGSAARGEMRDDSDIDLLYVFDDDAEWGVFDVVDMEIELAALLGRPVDLVSYKAAERHPNRRGRRMLFQHVIPIYSHAA